MTAKKAGLPRALGPPLVVGALLRCGVAALPSEPAWDGVIYLRAARQLAAGEGYTLRILSEAAPAEPTAFYPVGYPAFLAGLVSVGLDGVLLRVVQALIASLAILAAGLLARRLGGTRAGWIAAWLMALHPGSILLGGALLSEPVFSALMGMALALAVSTRRRAQPVALSVTGLWLGALTLMRPASALVAGIGAVLLGRQRSARHALLYGALAIALVTLALAPWMARNQAALGSPIPVATNGGFNLLLGTVGIGGYGALPAELDCPRALSEVDKDRCRRDRAIERMIAAPATGLMLVGVKLANTFGHESSPTRYLLASLRVEDAGLELAGTVVGTGYLWLLWALAARGLLRPSISSRARAMTLAPLLATALLHGLVLGGDRYHLPIVPMLCALAGCASRRRA